MKIRTFKSFLVSFLLLTTIALQGQEQDSSCASIHIYRPSTFNNSLIDLSVYVDDTRILYLKNNASLEVLIPAAGTHTVSARWVIRGEMYRKRSAKTVAVNCEQKKVFVQVNSGAFEAENLLDVVQADQGLKELAEIPEMNLYLRDLNGDDPEAPEPQQITFGNNREEEETEEPAGYVEETSKPVISRSQESNPPPPPPPASVPSNFRTKGVSYALIIGVNEYQDYSMNDLDQPVSDATKLYNVLLSRYTFTKQTVTFLKNPGKDDITGALDDLYERLTPDDNLFVFYAGHGYWDEKFQQGYWLAADANRDNRGTWLSNGTIRDYVRAIPSKHTLLVTDACFGGGIFKSRAAFSNSSTAINQLYELPSRKAMTSGAMSEVPDRSVFLEYLVKRLEQNTDRYLSSEQLFASFKIAVINNSANGQVPQFGEIRETGDEGGDYIFILK